MSEEPPQFTPDESQRIEDPEKAHAMALAGDRYRTTANHLYEEGAKKPGGNDMGNTEAEYYLDEAEADEEKAGRQYDAEQSRVQDPDKAHAMAMAGDELRTAAANMRSVENSGETHIIENGKTTSERLDEQAEGVEEEAGRLYDTKNQQYSAEDEPGPDANRKVEVAFKPDSNEKLEAAETDGLTQEDQVKILEHMTEVLRTHSISEAFKQAHLTEGNVSTAEGLLALGIKAHKEAQEFDRLRFSKPQEALPHLDEARACVKILAEITSGKASDPNYQINS